ncbi:MAG: transglycosylase domain-containing protein [Dehalococcoidia bacterium]
MTASSIARARRRRARRRRRIRVNPLAPLLAVGGLTFVLAVVVGTVVISTALALDYVQDAAAAGDESPTERMRALSRGGARIYDRNGVFLYEFLDPQGVARKPVPLEDISPWLVDATVATEDPTFYLNPGVNFRGLARAAFENAQTYVEDGSLGGSGGSSITQQLARNLYMDVDRRAERSVDRKLQETIIALDLTRRHDKADILEWYFNSISYGGNFVGVEAAAQGYFGKPAGDLTLAEAALLAGIPQSPSQFDPYVSATAAKTRQGVVLDLMVRREMITAEEAARAADAPIVLVPPRRELRAPHFVLGRVADEIRARFGERALYDDGLIVTTTLDMRLQDHASALMDEWISKFEDQSNGHNGALYALDPHTGEILVYVGSRDYYREDIKGQNDNVVAVNSPGSTLKPFTYMSAFIKGWSPSTGILDEPLTLVDPLNGDEFEVRDPIRQYQGVMTAADALGNSMNIPAVKTILYAGVEDTRRLMERVGFTTLDSPAGYGPALTVGGADITLQDLVLGYSVLATGGVLRGQDATIPQDPGERTIEPVALLEVKDSSGEVLYSARPKEERIVAESFTYLVTSILTDPKTQCVTFSTCGALTVDAFEMAAKTGTSEPFSGEDTRSLSGETWAVGYTSDLVAGVWYGNSDNTPMHSVYSTQVGWPILRTFMVDAHEMSDLHPEAFERPESVIEVTLCEPSGRLATSACPRDRRVTGLMAEEALPHEESDRVALQDTWWQRSRTGRVRLVYPATLEEELGRDDDWTMGAETTRFVAREPGPSAEPRDRAVTTADGGHLALAEYQGAPFTQLNSPNNGGTVRGAVSIRGSAAASSFRSATLQIGVGGAPSQFETFGMISGNVLNNQLGVWNTASWPDGVYTVRVIVIDGAGRASESRVTVTVANGRGD